jgi:hypothetical protein
MGILASVSGIGCAAIDAMVSRSNVDARPTTERLTAIARVFENQGHLGKAETMYHMALKQDPGNSFAQERATYIASLGNSKSFGASQTEQAVAMADAVETRTSAAKTAMTAPDLADAAKSQIASISTVVDNTVADNSTVDAIAAAEQAVEEAAAAAEEATVAVAAPVEEVHIEAASTVEQALAAFQDDSERAREQTVSFEADAALDEAATTEEDAATAEDTAAAFADIEQTEERPVFDAVPQEQFITLDQVASWIDAPSEHTDDLILALETGEDTGVRSLAAALLAECQADSAEINSALEAACTDADSLLRVTIRDTQLRQGMLSAKGVDDLVILLTDHDAEIQSQAAASLRYCVNSEYSERCINGLIALLEDGNQTVRGMAAATLGDFGSQATIAQQPLQDALASETDEANIRAIRFTLDRLQADQPVAEDEPVQLLPFVE